jgi:solute carrier family 25 (adenine nucleotide translocator) protein 4/5/6/31
MSQNNNKNHFQSFIKDLISGGLAAGVSKTLVAPIETVKLRLQSMDEMVKQNTISTPYKGITNCISRIIKEEGFLTFWNGNVTNILSYFPTQSLNFALKSYFKRSFPQSLKSKPLLFNITCGSAAGVTSMLFFHPFDFAKTKLANDAKNILFKKPRKYKGFFDVYKQTFANVGPMGIYRGLIASCCCMCIYRGLYFGLYDSVNKKIKNLGIKFVAGWGITIISGAVAYPFDTVRRRMIMTSGVPNSYTNSIECMKKIIQKEGVKSLYKGHGANILRSLAGAGVLVLYDKFKDAFSKSKQKNMKENK